MDFELESDYSPTGDQPEAIQQLVNGLKRSRITSNTSRCYWFREKPLQLLTL